MAVRGGNSVREDRVVREGRAARWSAALIALAALGAMVPPIVNGLGQGEALPHVIWSLLRFFTILTNLVVGVVWARLALSGRTAVSPLVQGGAMLAIVLVGLVYNLVLEPMPQPNWWSALGDDLHHFWVPLAVPLWWLAFTPHRALRWSAPLLWALYPLAYSAYSVGRAALEGTGVPYFFMDAQTVGWPAALFNMGAIAAAFVVTGMVAVAVDRRLP